MADQAVAAKKLDEAEFLHKLVGEPSLFCMPESCFGVKNYIRIALLVPLEVMIEACERMKEFCEAHHNLLRPTVLRVLL